MPSSRSGSKTNTNVDLAVLVEGAGKEEVNGVYQKLQDRNEYRMESNNGNTYQLDIRNDSWCIGSVGYGGGILYTALVSNDDPDFPPSEGWSSFRYSYRAPTVTVLNRIPELRSTEVSEVTGSIFESLLFSEEFSDLSIVCQDNVAIPAHKCVLAASSEYFQAAFRGPWKENQVGLFEVAHPAHVVKEVLTLIYTGKTTSDLVRDEPLAFLSVAFEFDLAWLKTLAEPSCIRLLDLSTLKAVWQAAHVYEIEALKKACVDFTKKNPLQVLTSSSIVDIKTEDPTSWQEFINAIEGKAAAAQSEK